MRALLISVAAMRYKGLYAAHFYAGPCRIVIFIFFPLSRILHAHMSTRPEIVMPCRCFTYGRPVDHLWAEWQQARRAAAAAVVSYDTSKTLDRLACTKDT